MTVVPRVHVAGAFLSSVTSCGFAETGLSAPHPTSFRAGVRLCATFCFPLPFNLTGMVKPTQEHKPPPVAHGLIEAHKLPHNVKVAAHEGGDTSQVLFSLLGTAW